MSSVLVMERGQVTFGKVSQLIPVLVVVVLATAADVAV